MSGLLFSTIDYGNCIYIFKNNLILTMYFKNTNTNAKILHRDKLNDSIIQTTEIKTLTPV